MNFELKHMLRNAPRFKEDLKTEIHLIAERIVDRFCILAGWLRIERLLPRHILLIFIQMACDPFVRMNRYGICKQQNKVKSMSKVFHQSIMKTTEALEIDPRYGKVDKRVVKGTSKTLDDRGLRYNSSAAVLIAGCIADVCRILLTCTNTLAIDKKKTISLDHLKEHSCNYRLSSGDMCQNDSLIRFLHSIHEARIPLPKEETKTVATQPKHNKRSKQIQKTEEREEKSEEKSEEMERKRVSFCEAQQAARLCFWEED